MGSSRRGRIERDETRRACDSGDDRSRAYRRRDTSGRLGTKPSTCSMTASVRSRVAPGGKLDVRRSRVPWSSLCWAEKDVSERWYTATAAPPADAYGVGAPARGSHHGAANAADSWPCVDGRLSRLNQPESRPFSPVTSWHSAGSNGGASAGVSDRCQEGRENRMDHGDRSHENCR